MLFKNGGRKTTRIAMKSLSTETLYEKYLRHPKLVIDSRKVSSGCIFFALKGSRVDGNSFAQQALDMGASYAVVDDPQVASGEQFLYVDDVLQAMQNLARHHRRQFSIPIIAITGSNGKTTTKELVASVLGSQYKIHFTQGNYNNHIGVPLTLLAMPADTDVAVIEMGANHQGEIAFLCEIAEPSHGLITNIGKAHLEGFGGIEGVKKGKSELYRYLAATNGMAFINREMDHLEALAGPVKKKVFYKQSKQPSAEVADLEVKLLESEPFLRVAFLDRRTQQLVAVQTQLYGSYNISNIMTAISLGKYFKVPGEKIKTAIEAYLPTNNRSQLITYRGNKIVLDAYNANPTSMQAAIKAFSSMEASHKGAILGDMLELGEDSELEHETIARLALDQHYDWLVLVGKAFEPAAQKHRVLHFKDVTALKEWFDKEQKQGQSILIKGSRGIMLEKMLGQ
jgi:UDP-N-acetylmuramoyl-tripeptide--D-alanyl-D-alanine ligase